MAPLPKTGKYLAAAAGAALLLRLIVCFQFSSLPAVVNPNVQTDMATYARLAAEIASGNFPDHYDYQPFYYTVFLPFCRIFPGSSPWGAMLIQALLGAATVWLAGITAEKLFGKHAGLTAAILLCISRLHVFYTPFMLFEVLQGFWMMLFLWLCLKCLESNRTLHWCLAALVLACAVLTRGNALLLLPGFILAAIYKNWNAKLKALCTAVAIAAIFELPQLPFAIRNYSYTGRWCGPSTAGEKVLALGNTPEAPPGGLEYPLTYHRWCEEAEKAPGNGRISMSSRILQWAAKEPVIFGELVFRKLLLFWDSREISNNVSLETEGQACFLTRLPLLLPFALLGPLALLGIFRSASTLHKEQGFCREGTVFLLYMVLVSWLGTALFYNLARFRLTALPLLAVAAGAAAAWGAELREQMKTAAPEVKQKKLLPVILAVLAAVFIVNTAYSAYASNCEPVFMAKMRPRGMEIDFPDTTLVYDHGPLMFGGFTFIEVPEQGLKIHKRLAVPGNSGTVAVRIPATGWNPGVRLIHDGKTYLPGSLKSDRFLRWLEAELPELKADDDGFAQVTWVLPYQKGFGAGIDTQRNYGRTSCSQGSEAPQVLDCEAAVEFQWQKKPEN